MVNLLQPRARSPGRPAASTKQVRAPDNRKDKGGGKGKNKNNKARKQTTKDKNKGKGKGKKRKQQDKNADQDDWPENWARFVIRNGQRKPFCRRFSESGCEFSNCKFEHLCPVWTDSGPCGGNHPAWDHDNQAGNGY